MDKGYGEDENNPNGHCTTNTKNTYALKTPHIVFKHFVAYICFQHECLCYSLAHCGRSGGEVYNGKCVCDGVAHCGGSGGEVYNGV